MGWIESADGGNGNRIVGQGGRKKGGGGGLKTCT